MFVCLLCLVCGDHREGRRRRKKEEGGERESLSLSPNGLLKKAMGPCQLETDKQRELELKNFNSQG